MISIPDLAALVKGSIPDAEVEILDKTGMSDHFIIHVTSATFEPMDLMARHRAVQAVVNQAMEDGSVHAAEIKTALPS